MTLFATEKQLPAPFAVDAVVVNDITSRSLGVRLSERASGFERLWWNQAWRQLKTGLEDGWRNHPYVFASAPGAYQVAHVEPVDFQMLRVSFPPGVAAYASLISRPGLVAIATIDRNTSQFVAVRFLNRGVT